MADDDRAGAQPCDESLQPFQAVQVEVVRRLVEQEDVVPGEQQRSETGAGRLASGEGGHRLVEPDGQTEGSGHFVGALVQVGAAEIEPAFERGGVRVVRAGGPVDEALGGFLHGALGGGDARTAGQEGPYGLAVAPLRLLREMADGGGGRRQLQLAVLGGVEPGEEAQQRGFSGAVDSDETDHVPRRDDEIEAGEERAVTVARGEVFGDKGCSHEGTDLRPTGNWRVGEEDGAAGTRLRSAG